MSFQDKEEELKKQRQLEFDSDLKISSNKLMEIKSQLAKEKKCLDLSKIGLTEIDGSLINVFEFNRCELKSLKLNGNKITRIGENTFEDLSTLKILHLNSNKLENIDSKTFKGLNKLEVLSLNNNELTRIEPSLFKELSNLRKLHLNNNKLGKIDANTFKGLGKLEKLCLNKNEINELDDNVFQDLLNLRELNLLDNKLKVIGSNTFGKLVNLEILYLNDNEIEEINERLFENLSNLRELYLYNNKLETINSNSFKGLTKLENLSLNNNGFTSIVSFSFEGLSNLIELNLFNNRITKIEANAFKDVGKIDRLYLNRNEIVDLNSNSFEALSNLKELNLSENKLRKIDRDAFEKNMQLEILYLSYNEIVELNVCLSLGNLIELHLNNNKLKRIDSNAFKMLEKLNVLLLNDNELIELDSSLFSTLSNLKSLSLNNNKLKQIDIRCFDNLNTIGVIQLYGNDFKALSYLKISNVKSILYHDMDELNKNGFLSDWDEFRKQFHQIIDKTFNFSALEGEINLKEKGDNVNTSPNISIQSKGKVFKQKWMKMDENLNHELEAFKKELIELKNKSPLDENAIRLQLDKVGRKCKELEKYDETLRYYKECLIIEKQILPSNHSSIANTLNNIGSVYKDQGKYEEALKYYNQSLEMKKQTFPSNHSSIADTLNNIGSVYYNQGKYESAINYLTDEKLKEECRQKLREQQQVINFQANEILNRERKERERFENEKTKITEMMEKMRLENELGEKRFKEELGKERQNKLNKEQNKINQVSALLKTLPVREVKSDTISTVWITRDAKVFTDKLIGQVIYSKYKIDNYLGQGGFGKVFTLLDLEENNIKVIKMIKEDHNDWENEAMILSRLSHENLVKYHDHFELISIESLCHPCIITEYCQNGDLSKRIKETKSRKEKFPDKVILNWIYQATKGLLYLHSMSIIHRDIKPENILLSGDNVVKLADLGGVKVIRQRLMTSFSSFGTVFYMSPEILNLDDYSFPTDIWSLGCVLYELVFLELAHRNRGKEHPSGGSQMFSATIKRMLVEEPSDRINAQNLYDDLKKLKQILGI